MTSTVPARPIAAVLTALALLVTACGSDSTTSDDQARPDGPPPEPVGDLWAIRGYGYVVAVVDGQVTDTYLRVDDGEAGACVEAEFAPLSSFEVSGDTGTLEIADSITRYRIERTELPPGCALTEGDSSPQTTIDTFIALFDRHYPFFDERDVDWDQAKTELRAAGAEAVDTEAAALAIADVLWELGDTHNSIGVDSEPPAQVIEYHEALEAELEVAGDELMDTVGPLTTSDATDAVSWARPSPEVGYLLIERLAAMVDLWADVEDDLPALQAAMDEALTDLADTERLIIDLRFNGGGADLLSLEVASRFVDGPVEVFTKEAYATADLTRQVVSIDRSALVTYDGPISVLVSPATASAAEVLGVSLDVGADATVIGPRSEGIFSDVIPWLLPGGVELGLTMEVYRDLDGRSYEVRGVPIDVETTIAESLPTALALP